MAALSSVQQVFRAVAAGDDASLRRAFGLNPALLHAKHPRNGHTLLHAAAALGNLPLLRDLLHAGASCQARDGHDETPLHVAARQGCTAVVRELLTDAGRRSCMRAANHEGATPLHLAVMGHHGDAVRLLLNAGARADMRDKMGRTPLELLDDGDELVDVLQQGRQLTPSKSKEAQQRARPVNPPANSCQPTRATTIVDAAPPPRGAADGSTAAALPVGDSGGSSNGNSNDKALVVQQDSNRVGDAAAAAADAAAADNYDGDNNGSTITPVHHAAHEQFCAPSGFGREQPQEEPSQWGKVLQPPSVAACVQQDASQVSILSQQQLVANNSNKPCSMGPLRRAQAAGPGGAGAAAAAAAADDLARMFFRKAGAALPGGGGGGGDHLCSHHVPPASQEPSTVSVVSMGATGITSSPELTAEGGLLHPQHCSTGLEALLQRSARTGHHLSWQASACSHVLSMGGPDSMPSSPPLHRAVDAAPNLAALTAAVAATSRVGPLKLPLQIQLSEVAAKVQQLEAWATVEAEMVPEWQAATALTQVHKGQLEENSIVLEQLLQGSKEQQASIMSLLDRMAAMEDGYTHTVSRATLESAKLQQVTEQQEDMRGMLTELSRQIGDLQAQVVRQSSVEAGRATADDARMSATEALHTMMAQQIQALVGSLESLQASKAADAEAVQDITARITALEGAGLTDVGSRATHASGPAETTGAGVDETLLPFMETTSKCLAAHEQQLDAMQALLPRLEGFVTQRSQMCELRSQVAALQTAFALFSGQSKSGGGAVLKDDERSARTMVDHLALATSMVTLQSQVGECCAEMQQLQLDWQATSARLKADQEAMRGAWEELSSHMAAAERETARRMADQHRELSAREERLVSIREAAFSAEAERRSTALDSEERVNSSLADVMDRYQKLEGRFLGVTEQLGALQEQLGALQDETSRETVAKAASEGEETAPAGTPDPSNPFLQSPQQQQLDGDDLAAVPPAPQVAPLPSTSIATPHEATPQVVAQGGTMQKARTVRQGWFARTRRLRKGADQFDSGTTWAQSRTDDFVRSNEDCTGEDDALCSAGKADAPTAPPPDASKSNAWRSTWRKLAARTSWGGGGDAA